MPFLAAGHDLAARPGPVTCPGPWARLSALPDGRFLAETPHPDGATARLLSRSLLEPMLLTAARRASGHRPVACDRPAHTLVVVRVDGSGSLKRDAARAAGRLGLAVRGLPDAAEVLEDAATVAVDRLGPLSAPPGEAGAAIGPGIRLLVAGRPVGGPALALLRVDGRPGKHGAPPRHSARRRMCDDGPAPCRTAAERVRRHQAPGCRGRR